MTDHDMLAIEARKVKLTQVSNKDGNWYDVTFQIHPNDAINTNLAQWPLRQRVSLVVARIKEDGAGDAEKPTEPEHKQKREHRDWDDVPPTEQAGIRCNEPLFQTWLHEYLGGDDPEFPTEQAVRNYCGVKSRSELNTDRVAATYWRKLDMEYQEFVSQKRFRTQLESGPS